MNKTVNFFLNWNWTQLMVGIVYSKDEREYVVDRIYVLCLGMLSIGFEINELKSK